MGGANKGSRTGGAIVVAALAWVAAPAAAQTSVIAGPGSLAGANPINLPAANQVTQGPVTFGDGAVTFSSNVTPGSLFGWTNGYVFGNGTVTPDDPPILALDAGSNGLSYASMFLDFATPTSGFLAELFWTNGASSNGNSSVIDVFDAAGNQLAYLALNNNGAGGRPQNYYGFQSATANIARVRFSNSFIGARNLSYVGPAIGAVDAVPEPAGWALMIAGMGLTGAALRARRRRIRFA